MSHIDGSHSADPDVAARRALQQAHTRDGLFEILCGGVLLLASASQWSLLLLPPSLPRDVLHVGLMVFWIGLCFAANWILTFARHRWLLDRTGYVKERQPRPSLRAFVAVTAVALSAGIAAVLANRWSQATPLLQNRANLLLAGLGIGLFVMVIGRRLRFFFTGSLTILLAMALAFTDLPQDFALACVLTVTGGIVLATGSFVLIRFLQSPVDAG
ncbi:MAG: hypothetical protein KGJ78_13615 [Alphaproteobacteria bacterium]|nr:hypothetical protein [Alphaproteobacteria bacterium]